MQVFTRVVEARSFTKAAEAMLLSRSSVTTVIQNLEASLGVQLLLRTTRRLNLTIDGEAYYEQCRRILADLEQAEAFLRRGTDRPRGRLRVEIAGSIGRLIVLPALRGFHERYPDVELLIGFGDQSVDFVQDGIDCAIRVGALPSSTLVARRIDTLRSIVCASPEYLARHGEPKTIADLSRHHAVNLASNPGDRPKEWVFTADGGIVSAKLQSRLTVNESSSHVMCGLQGLGLIRPLECLARPYLRSGRLREVLSHLKVPSEPLSVIYPRDRIASPAVRVFVDWIAELFERAPALPRLQMPAA